MTTEIITKTGLVPWNSVGARVIGIETRSPDAATFTWESFYNLMVYKYGIEQSLAKKMITAFQKNGLTVCDVAARLDDELQIHNVGPVMLRTFSHVYIDHFLKNS